MKREKREEGQSLVELVLVLPVLLIILAGLLDLGRLYYAYVAVTDAAAEGATYGAFYAPSSDGPCAAAQCTDDPRDVGCLCRRAEEATEGLVQIAGEHILVECPECQDQYPESGDPITVTVTYSFTLATPLLNAMVPGGVLPLRAVATEAILVGAAQVPP
jgi:Flp pilus assembly protein TadG